MARLRAAALVAVLAAGLRFAELGAWSFAGDEVATTRETFVLFGELPDPGGQTSRLPRLLPAGYLVQYVGYRVFGWDEFGSRMPAAVAGVVLPPLAVVLLWPSLGGWGAVSTGLLLALSPEAILQSQQNRFYMASGLVAGACVVAAARSTQSGGVLAFQAACGLAVVAPFFHPVLAALAPGLAAVALVSAPTENRTKNLLTAGATVITVATVIVVYHLPLMQGWNAGAGWGYGPGRAVLGGVKRLGVPTLLLACVGTALMFRANRPMLRFWAVWATGWGATLVVFPVVLAYHPAYSFPFAFGPTVLAGYAVGEVARGLDGRAGRGAAAIWIGAAGMMNAPVLVSYYADGSRYDYRAAAAFVAERRHEGEPVAAVSPGNLSFYQPSLADTVGLDPNDLGVELGRIEGMGQTTWVVLPAGRGGRVPDAQERLNQSFRLVRTFRRPRLDYDEFVLDVYRFMPREAR